MASRGGAEERELLVVRWELMRWEVWVLVAGVRVRVRVVAGALALPSGPSSRSVLPTQSACAAGLIIATAGACASRSFPTAAFVVGESHNY